MIFFLLFSIFDMKSFLSTQIQESVAVKQALLSGPFVDQIFDMSNQWIECLQAGGQILIAGNGGSAGDAQHIAGELVSRFFFDRPALRSVALTTDTSILTAIGNDYGYERVFSRQIEALGKAGDIFVGITTSGTSKNIVAGFEAAKKKGMICMALAGEKQGPLNEMGDLVINVPSTVTPRIQEAHILIGHLVCAAVEQEIFGAEYGPK